VGDLRDRVDPGALAQDRHARVEVRWLELCDEAVLEPLLEARLENAELARLAVAGDDELRAGLVERVERMEELLFGPHLLGEELDVVDEQDVGAAEAFAEGAIV